MSYTNNNSAIKDIIHKFHNPILIPSPMSRTDLDSYILLRGIDTYFNPAKDGFDHVEYERNMLEPDGIYILFSYCNN